MATPCSKCKYNNTLKCTGPCETFQRWKENPAKVEAELKKDELPPGVYWITLDIRRENVCAQDCMDLSRSIKVRSDQRMADLDDELKQHWLPKGYNWVGGSRNGTVKDYVRFGKQGFLTYSHR